MVSVYWPDLNLDKGKNPSPGKRNFCVFSWGACNEVNSTVVNTRLPHVHTEENPDEADTQDTIAFCLLVCLFVREHKSLRVCFDKSISLIKHT